PDLGAVRGGRFQVPASQLGRDLLLAFDSLALLILDRQHLRRIVGLAGPGDVGRLVLGAVLGLAPPDDLQDALAAPGGPWKASGAAGACSDPGALQDVHTTAGRPSGL